MPESKQKPLRKNKRKYNFIPVIIILALLIGIPVLILNYQSRRIGLNQKEVVNRLLRKSGKDDDKQSTVVGLSSAEKIDFLEPMPIGKDFSDPPLISNISATDLDKDGLLDVLVCDSRENTISWIRQYPAGTYTEIILAEEIIAPSHIQAYDFDNDGDLDLIVGVLGMLFPNNDKIGSVVILENNGAYEFTKHVVVDKIARVYDVRAGDLDGDGDNDLAVAQFGYDDGETRWIENLGNWNFESHILQYLSGPINVEILDIDNDNDLDILVLVSQEWEEIYCFLNEGNKNFQPKLLFGSSNEDFGSSMMTVCDYDKDGDQDILYTNGDAFDYIPPQGRPWHGVNILENKGDLNFEFRRLTFLTGATYMKPADIDNDSDIDFFAVSTWNLWDDPQAVSLIWLENIDNIQFVKHEITNNPTHLLCCEPGDFNNDGLIDLVTCGMHTFPPYDRMGRITLWINNGALID